MTRTNRELQTAPAECARCSMVSSCEREREGQKACVCALDGQKAARSKSKLAHQYGLPSLMCVCIKYVRSHRAIVLLENDKLASGDLKQKVIWKRLAQGLQLRGQRTAAVAGLRGAALGAVHSELVAPPRPCALLRRAAHVQQGGQVLRAGQEVGGPRVR